MNKKKYLAFHTSEYIKDVPRAYVDSTGVYSGSLYHVSGSFVTVFEAPHCKYIEEDKDMGHRYSLRLTYFKIREGLYCHMRHGDLRTYNIRTMRSKLGCVKESHL